MGDQGIAIQPAGVARMCWCAVAGFGLSVAGCATTAAHEPFAAAPSSVIALGFAGDPPPSSPPPSSDDHKQTDSESLSEQQQRQLQVFTATLLSVSPDIDSETRRSAAQELLAMNRPESLEVIATALGSRSPTIMLAAVTAMQTTRPVPALLEPAVAALPGVASSVLEPLSWVIARHGEPAVKKVAPLATDKSASIAARMGPIRALSAFDSQSAAEALMRIVNDEGESIEAVNAACESLQRLTGLSYNTDVRQWRAWWSQAGGLAQDEWSAFINQSLSKRAAQLQQDLQRQREVNDRIARELFNAYRDLYPTLPVDEQMRRLSAMLQDPLPPLREFAIARIALLLRDSVRIPVELQQKLAERLNDDVPSLRIEAAKLLDELNDETLGPTLASRLASEQSPTVIAAFLDVLGRRPTPQAIEPARRWLSDANLGSRAANVIWRALQSGATLSPDDLTNIRNDLLAAIALRPYPSAFRVLALIGNDSDVEKLTSDLDGDDLAIRAAIAEGFCVRGLRLPLIQRAADPVVFPFAVRVIGDGPADVASLRQLIALTPTETHQQIWIDGCLKLCDRLPPNELLAADDLLLASSSADPRIRNALLTRATSLPREELTREDRDTLVLRYAGLLMEQSDPARAHALLETVGCNTPQASDLCFRAAALCGQYEKAWQLRDTAAEWLALLVQVADRDLQQAAPLVAEIARRFDGRLDDQEQETLDRILRLVREAAASAKADESAFSIPR